MRTEAEAYSFHSPPEICKSRKTWVGQACGSLHPSLFVDIYQDIRSLNPVYRYDFVSTYVKVKLYCTSSPKKESRRCWSDTDQAKEGFKNRVKSSETIKKGFNDFVKFDCRAFFSIFHSASEISENGIYSCLGSSKEERGNIAAIVRDFRNNR